MTTIAAVILSVVEGVTEFLPISSTGHMILTGDVLGMIHTEFVKTFEIFIQLGAIVAVLTLYAKRLLVNPAVWQRVLVAFVPTGIAGALLYKVVKQYLLGNSMVVVWSLLIGGGLILVAEAVYSEKKAHITTIEEMPFTTAAVLGLAQAVAMVPGVSRAAATILAGMGMGMKRKVSVEFSFLLAVPTMVAAAGLDLLKSAPAFSGSEFILLLVGFTGAFITALLSVKWLVAFVQHHSFRIFGVYRIMTAVLFWMLVLH